VSDVTVIGTGNMGSALARVLLQRGRSVTVWNRSGAKTEPLVATGAHAARDAASAVAASGVVLVCVTDQRSWDELTGAVAAQLPGRLLVQTSTGSPDDARSGEARARAHGAAFLAVAITGSPASMGTAEGHVVCSGAQAAFDTVEPLLRDLAGRVDYRGAEVGAASAWDMVLIGRYYGMFLSLLHSVQVCEAEGIPLSEFESVLREQGRSYEAWLVENVRTRSFGTTSAPLELWAGAIDRMAGHAATHRLHGGLPRLAADLFSRAMAAGYGREEVSALYKVLRDGDA
jgi:3-hydroxyisobutyrate dehydrogenase-like beta-hydroxyacid dehydrogenase